MRNFIKGGDDAVEDNKIIYVTEEQGCILGFCSTTIKPVEVDEDKETKSKKEGVYNENSF